MNVKQVNSERNIFSGTQKGEGIHVIFFFNLSNCVQPFSVLYEDHYISIFFPFPIPKRHKKIAHFLV